MKLKDITLIEFTELDDKTRYVYASKYSRYLNEPEDLFNIGDITKLSFGTVKDLQYTFPNVVGIYELLNFVSEFKNISPKKLGQYSFFSWCRFRRFIEVGLETITTLELNLAYETSMEDESDGINSLSKFGVMIQIDKLALGDIRRYDEIRNMPYDTCFTKLLMDKEIEEYKQSLIKRK